MRQLEQDFDTFNHTFPNGSDWVRADFHLHTRADKEFSYNGDPNQFVTAYIAGLKAAGIRIGVITNHNKFDYDEFRTLRRAARREGIGLLPGVELSVADGASGIHTLVGFSDQWLEDGVDHINPFLMASFAGRAPEQYEQENARSNDDLLNTLHRLDSAGRDFFVVFAHVEQQSGLWRELAGGRIQELSQKPLIQKHALGFQKVRSHDKPDGPCRVKVKQWWHAYPAEVEGSDAKSIDQIGKGNRYTWLKIGDLTFDAIRFALKDYPFRVAEARPKITHSFVRAIRFEGGLLNEARISFSPHLNCLIGIQGSGKSSALECLRYALDIPFGENPQDRAYKEKLVPYVLQSGGRVIVEAVDHLGTAYEVRRIYGHAPEVFVNGALRSDVMIRENVVRSPLYFGQKDLSAAGQGFGKDLVDKLVGDSLSEVRETIWTTAASLRSAVAELKSVDTDNEVLSNRRTELASVEYQIEQFDKHGVRNKLDKQLAFKQDSAFAAQVDDRVAAWRKSAEKLVADGEEDFADLAPPASTYNADFFKDYSSALHTLKEIVARARDLLAAITATQTKLTSLGKTLQARTESLKEEFAQTERELLTALAEQGVTSLRPDDYVRNAERKTKLEEQIADLEKSTSKAEARRNDVTALISSFNEACLDEFKATSAALNKINGAQAALQIKPTFKGDKKGFAGRLEQAMKGSGMRSDHIEKICQHYVDFAAIYADLDNAAGMARGRADAFRDYFLTALSDLLTFQIANTYDVTYHGRPLRSHSLGQRASAMMLFLLSQDDHDLLLIDQPEDDLDSQTVYEEVVKLVRALKPGRQFIFATHNANFPVLGDAESISSFSATEEAISVNTASIDARRCQERIINIMEGGPEAFERRKAIYEIWKSAT